MKHLVKSLAPCLIVLLLALTGFAADHKEAPLAQDNPQLDINDLYAFLNPNDPTRLVLAMTVNPFSVPGAATSYRFSEAHLYRFKIDNNGDALPDHSIDIAFDDGQAFDAFFRIGGVTMDTVHGEATPATIADTPTNAFIFESGDLQVFAGPRDDPFFFDSVGFGRFLSGIGGFDGTDGFAGFNVSAIVVEFPVDLVLGGSTNLNIWATVESPIKTKNGGRGFTAQIERVGNPAVSTAVIPGNRRDEFNRTPPHKDAELFAADIVASLESLGTNAENIGILASVAVPDVLTINTGLPSGFPNGRGLADDVIDTILFFVFNQTPVSDGVDANDVAFLDEFPYLAPPFQP